jgi:hypothetical protein
MSNNNNSVDNILASAFSGIKVINDVNIEKVSDMLDRFDIRWSVSKQPLLLRDGTITKFSAIVRDDNNDVFTTCKDGYVPYQNSELA